MNKSHELFAINILRVSLSVQKAKILNQQCYESFSMQLEWLSFVVYPS